MDLLKLLKELKKIEPDKDFTLKSRSFILNLNKLDPASRVGQDRPAVSVWQILRSNIEFGASIALMVAMVYVMLGGLSSSKVGAPIQISNLDPAGLRAEAQAIDIQIQLTNLSSLKLSESTPALQQESGGGTTGFADLKNNSTTVEYVSVDEALDKLSR